MILSLANERLLKVLAEEYAKWKVTPAGVIVAVTHPWSYTNTRIHVNCDEFGYSQAF